MKQAEYIGQRLVRSTKVTHRGLWVGQEVQIETLVIFPEVDRGDELLELVSAAENQARRAHGAKSGSKRVRVANTTSQT